MKKSDNACLIGSFNELALRSKLLCSTMVLAICTSAFGTASAQQAVSPNPQDEVAEPGDSKRLGTVTVTARKIEENLQEVPVAVTAFTGAELEAQGAIGFQDVSNFTPGLTTVGALGNDSALYLSMRGQVQNDTLATLEPSIGTYVDGHYWARAYGLTTDLLDVESVQVLKGPQGTLFGRNTTGGALVFETADPDFEGVHGSIKGTIGNYNEQAVEAIANIPLIEDKLAIRGAAKLQSRDGFVKDIVSNDEYSDKHVSQARVKVLFEPTDKLTFDFSGEWFTYKTRPAFLPFYAGPGTRGIALGFPDPNFATIDEYLAQTTSGRNIAVDGRQFSKAETTTFTGTATYDVNSTDQIKVIAGSRKVKTRQQGDLDGTPYLLNTTTLEQDLEHWSVELQYTGVAFADRLNYVVGATYFEEEGYDRSFTWAFPDAVNPTISQFYGFIDNASTGIYAQGSYDLTEKLAVTLGIRNSSDEKGIATRNATLLRADPSVILFCANSLGTVADRCEVQPETPTFEEVSYLRGSVLHSRA